MIDVNFHVFFFLNYLYTIINRYNFRRKNRKINVPILKLHFLISPEREIILNFERLKWKIKDLKSKIKHLKLTKFKLKSQKDCILKHQYFSNTKNWFQFLKKFREIYHSSSPVAKMYLFYFYVMHNFLKIPIKSQ